MTIANLPITGVVVHPDGAIVTRQGTIALDPLVHAGEGAKDADELQIRELPLLLDPGSVRVSAKDSEGKSPVRSVTVDLDLLGEDRGPKPAILERWLRARESLARTDASLAALGRTRAALSSLVPAFDSDVDRPVPDAERWLSWLAASRKNNERLDAIDDERRALERSRRDQGEQIALLDLQLHQESAESWWKRWQPTRRVHIELQSLSGHDRALSVELSYRVPGASWSPAYTLDADGALKSGRFSMRALIVQATGEDWRQATLGLCSAPCERVIDVPELASQRLGKRSPPAPSGWRELPTGLEGLFPRDLAPPLIPDTTRTPDEDRVTGKTTAFYSAPSPANEEKKRDFGASRGGGGDDGLRTEIDQDEPKIYPQTATRSASKGGLFASVLDAIPTHSLSTASAPMGAPAPKPSPSRSLSRQVDGPSSAPRDAQDGDIEVGSDWLDYGRLRMTSWDQSPGQRGTLKAIDDLGELHEAALPAEAATRFSQWRSELHTAAARATGRPMPPHHVLPAPIGGTDVRIDASGTVDIPSDGRSHSISVQSWSAELAVAYRAVPRHDPRAFRLVTATVTYSHPLLPGPVDVYVDGRLELTSAWSGSPGRGQLQIGLGAEDRLTIARNVRDRAESTGLLGGSRRLTTTIEVSVASTMPHPVTIEILERIPVPLDGRNLTVEQTEASPVCDSYTGEPDGPILKGGRSQSLAIDAGGEARAILGYAVTLGKGEELVGGDRRG